MTQRKIQWLFLLSTAVLAGGCNSEEPMDAQILKEAQQFQEVRDKYPAVARRLDELTEFQAEFSHLIGVCVELRGKEGLVRVEPELRDRLRDAADRSKCLPELLDRHYTLTCVQPEDVECDEDCTSIADPDEMLECTDRFLECIESTTMRYLLEPATP